MPNFAWKPLAMLAVLGSVLVPASLVQAEEFDNGAVRFDADTIIEFEFIESNNAYQSTFGVAELDNSGRVVRTYPLYEETVPSDRSQDVTAPSRYRDDLGLPDRSDFSGSPGVTVPDPLAEFEFRADTSYAFYLESQFNGISEEILYSLDALNQGRQRWFKFGGTLSDLGNGGIVIRVEDTGSILVGESGSDQDFDDFNVRAGGHVACFDAGLRSGSKAADCPFAK